MENFNIKEFELSLESKMLDLEIEFVERQIQRNVVLGRALRKTNDWKRRKEVMDDFLFYSDTLQKLLSKKIAMLKKGGD